MQEGLKSMWRKKEEKEYPYNIEFGDGRTVEEKFAKAFKKRTGVVYQNWIQGWAITERQRKKMKRNNIIEWIKNRIIHKLNHLKPRNIKKVLKESGISLAVIIIGWEIIEDVLFPIFFIWLGNNVHLMFYVGAPTSWMLCLHWLMVPLIWGIWMRIKKMKK